MKMTKRIMAVLLAVFMLAALAVVPASAAGTGGTIKVNDIDGSVGNNQYVVIKMFDAEDVGAGKYVFTATEDWKAFGSGANISVNATTGAVTVSGTVDATSLAAFATTYANGKNLTTVGTVADGGNVVVNDDGYYLLYNAAGNSGVALLASSNTVEVNEKSVSGLPLVAKKVKEDSTGTWEATNTAAIGDTIDFQTTITTNAGADEYVLTDTMDDELTLDANSIKIVKKVSGEDDVILVKGTDYTVDSTANTFTVTFEDSALANVKNNDVIVVTYSAMLNDTVVFADLDFVNTTELTHAGGEKKQASTTTTTGAFTLKKVKEDGTTELDGAKFKLYDAATGGSEIKVVKNSDGTYRLATGSESGVEIEAGTVTIYGFDADAILYLEETDAPDGYVRLTSRTKAELGETTTIKNVPGTELPSTGGIGTTVFYVVGAVLVLGAVVLLLNKKRANA